jgi:hypothetical protein
MVCYDYWQAATRCVVTTDKLQCDTGNLTWLLTNRSIMFVICYDYWRTAVWCVMTTEGEDTLVWKRKLWIALCGERFGRGFGPVVRQTTEWMNDCWQVASWYVVTADNLLLDTGNLIWLLTNGSMKFVFLISFFIPTRLWRWNRQSFPKCQHIKLRFRGITQKKTYNMIVL